MDGTPEGFLAGSELFGALPEEVREALAVRLRPVTVEGGDVVMAAGDEADGLYLVASGRLQARVGEGDTTTVLGEIGRGEVVGESALLTAQPRTATVVALRDSDLLHLPVDEFESLVTEHPQVLRPVAAQVISRMAASIRGEEGGRPVTTVAIVPLHAVDRVREAAADLAAALIGVIGDATVATALDRPDSGNEAAWANDLEAQHELVVYVADEEVSDWTRRCLRQADVVVLVGDATASPTRTTVEETLDDRRKKVDIPVELVLVHPPSREIPKGTRAWLAPRRLRRHHHVRAGSTEHVERVARLLTDRAIGLVLSGGGARGMAEVGAIKAMQELGVPIDAVGGTSAGSLVAGAVARGWKVDRISRAMHEGMVEGSNPLDVTMPLAALAAGRRVTERLQTASGDIEIEDLWLDYFCVSTNLSRNAPQVHRSGLAWRAIRASMSIPGVFPPVAHEGDVLVDGGLVDNLPVGEMRRGHDGIRVVAVDVGVHRGLAAGDLPDSTVISGWQLLLDRLHPRRTSPDVAGILTVLTRLTELGGGQDALTADTGDLLITPDVERFPILDFSNFDALVAAGYEAGRPALEAWWEGERGPS
jgi:predicted acylesterase/phospholipase RssA/CRP-like cAMP-binding protein